MGLKTVAEFKIQRLEILNPDGENRSLGGVLHHR